MSVLNHEAGAGRFARAYNIHGIEVSVRQIIILKRLVERATLVQVNARTIHATGTDPCGLGLMQHERRPQ